MGIHNRKDSVWIEWTLWIYEINFCDKKGSIKLFIEIKISKNVVSIIFSLLPFVQRNPRAKVLFRTFSANNRLVVITWYKRKHASNHEFFRGHFLFFQNRSLEHVYLPSQRDSSNDVDTLPNWCNCKSHAREYSMRNDDVVRLATLSLRAALIVSQFKVYALKRKEPVPKRISTYTR